MNLVYLFHISSLLMLEFWFSEVIHIFFCIVYNFQNDTTFKLMILQTCSLTAEMFVKLVF